MFSFVSDLFYSSFVTFIHVCCCSFPFLWLCSIPSLIDHNLLSIIWLMDVWAVCRFGLLLTVLLWTCLSMSFGEWIYAHTHTYVCMHILYMLSYTYVCIFMLGIYVGVELLDNGLCQSSCIKYTPTSKARKFWLLHVLANIWYYLPFS